MTIWTQKCNSANQPTTTAGSLHFITTAACRLAQPHRAAVAAVLEHLSCQTQLLTSRTALRATCDFKYSNLYSESAKNVPFCTYFVLSRLGQGRAATSQKCCYPITVHLLCSRRTAELTILHACMQTVLYNWIIQVLRPGSENSEQVIPSGWQSTTTRKA